MSVSTHRLLLKLITLLIVVLAAGSSIVERASRPAQAPGFLPVVCSDSNDYTFDHTAKRHVDEFCNPFASAQAITAHTVSVQNIYIQGGVLQVRIGNSCDNPYQVGVDGCKLELYSIAYGCSENGRFYNGSSSYGCIYWAMQVFNDTALLPRADDDRLLCEFAQAGNYTTTTSTLAQEIAHGCGTYAEVSISPSKSFKWWNVQEDGSVVEFKVYNPNAVNTLSSDKVSCQNDLSFLADYCASPASGLFYHGHLRQDNAEWDIMVYPPGHNPLAIDGPTPIERRLASEPTCLDHRNAVASSVASDRKDSTCSSLDGDTLQPGRSKTVLWIVNGGGDLLIKLTNVDTTASHVISGSVCSAQFDSIIASCPAGPGKFGHGTIVYDGIRYEMEMLGINGGIGVDP